MASKRLIGKNHRELQLALERARTRLAVAIAAESKSTSPDRSRHYWETGERTRRLLKRLREENSEIQYPRQQWMEAAESLKRLPAHAEAAHLHRVLGEVLTKLEQRFRIPDF